MRFPVVARALVLAAVASLVSFTPASAQMPGAPMAPPMPPGGAQGAGTCPGGGASASSIAGDVAYGKLRLVPNAVSVMPVSRLSDAYVDNMRMAMGSDADRRRSLNLNRDPHLLDGAMYLAMHQADLMASIHYARTAGSHFSCVGLPPGSYYVMAIVSQAYRPRGSFGGYVGSTDRLVFYVARATVAPPARPHAPRKPAILSRFDWVGATASAM